MKKQPLWIMIPVTTAVLLALAGCGGPDSNAASSENSSSPTTTVGEQTETGSGGADFSNENETGTKENTGTTDNVDTSGSKANDNQVATGHSGVNDVIKQVRNQLKMKDAALPTSFTLDKGTSLGAAILSNTADAFKVNFYATTQSVAINDQSLTASDSKIPVLASYEVKTYKDPDQPEIFPETDLKDIPADMAVDLGHGIKGMSEGAAGSQYLTWQEGRWTLEIRSVSEDEMNNPGIAKKMVEYLELHTLPVPKDKGYIKVEYPSGGQSVLVTISWQDGNQIHQFKTDQVPLEALGMVVSVK
ncbi:hypothetical protein MHI48_13080 [Paenibacillus sp. FSL H7-0942]|uniref:hypothetical protein n=1 Tax=Paenibacillus TaxID=44249 RepID=UPI0003E24CF5|nr:MULTISPECIES: hypothetical protein [Paenibacillus]ETT37437.1 hypothetical protein C161_13038 [Paenibacillus sp. FSL R5-192]OMF02253.1 hypothetical protein BK124_06415 [Paenibacillus amylolyticus]